MDLHEIGDDGDPNLAKYIGASLIIGFTIMLLLDQGFLIYKEKEVLKQD